MRTFNDLCRASRPEPLPPWRGTEISFKAVQLEGKKKDHTEEQLREQSMKAINDLQVKHLIYTDGSTNADQEKGGAGVFVTNEEGEEVFAAQYPAGELCSLCSSFQCIAMDGALDWVAENAGDCAATTDRKGPLPDGDQEQG